MADSSVKMIWRTTNPKPPILPCTGSSCQAWATAPEWRGPYAWNTTSIFEGQPDVIRTHIEDAHLWVAPLSASHPGSFHAIFHSDVEKDSHVLKQECVQPPCRAAERHDDHVAVARASALVLDDDGVPIVRTNGAGYVNDCDHVFMFAQPINIVPHQKKRTKQRARALPS